VEPLSTGILAKLLSIAIWVLRKVGVWRYVICPAKKLAFPIKDQRSGIKQSRMRYYRVRFWWNGGEAFVFQEVDSNGNVRRDVTASGRRFLPPKLHEAKIVDDRFQFPRFGRMDWKDVFSGDAASGCCAISEP
jgi:hypothetical protein